MIAMAEAVNLRAIALLAGKRIIARNAAIVIQPKNLAVGAGGVLGLLDVAGGGRGHENRAVEREGQTGSADIGALFGSVEFLHFGERFPLEPGPSENGRRLIPFTGLAEGEIDPLIL